MLARKTDAHERRFKLFLDHLELADRIDVSDTNGRTLVPAPKIIVPDVVIHVRMDIRLWRERRLHQRIKFRYELLRKLAEYPV
jgi:hypothetical protein